MTEATSLKPLVIQFIHACTVHLVNVPVNSNVKLGTVVLCYAYLYPMVWHVYVL